MTGEAGHGVGAALSTSVPIEVLLTLLREVAVGTGAQLRESTRELGQRWGQLHPGDGFGRVLAWVWGEDPDLAMQMLADVFSGLRRGPGADLAVPPYTLEELLAGLRYALPDDVGDFDALAAWARAEVPGLYGDPLT